MKPKKIKLEEKSYNFVVFAIVTAEDDYRLVWCLNNALSLNLSRAEHPMLKKEIAAGKNVAYFTYKNENINVEYALIGNKYDEFRLFPQLSTTDFVLKISGNLTNEQINDIASSVRSVKEITACINLNVKKSSIFGVFERI
jgi:hypothetical protein